MFTTSKMALDPSLVDGKNAEIVDHDSINNKLSREEMFCVENAAVWAVYVTPYLIESRERAKGKKMLDSDEKISSSIAASRKKMTDGKECFEIGLSMWGGFGSPETAAIKDWSFKVQEGDGQVHEVTFQEVSAAASYDLTKNRYSDKAIICTAKDVNPINGLRLILSSNKGQGCTNAVFNFSWDKMPAIAKE